MTCFYQSSAGMWHAQTTREQDKKKKKGKIHSLYKVQMAFAGETVVMVHWPYTDIAYVNSMNKAVVIKIVEICCCSLQREGWALARPPFLPKA